MWKNNDWKNFIVKKATIGTVATPVHLPYVGYLKWWYLKIILISVNVVQKCGWNLLYMWSICQGLVHRINILYGIFFLRKWSLTFCTRLCKIFMVTVYRKKVLSFVDSHTDISSRTYMYHYFTHLYIKIMNICF